MTKLSRRPIDPTEFGHYVNNLWAAFTLMDSKEDTRLLFKDLFTHTEYKMFAKRLEIARRLITGQTYEQIMQDLKVTPKTVTNVSNILANAGNGLRKADEKLKDLERTYQRHREERQAVLERRVRRKLPAEIFLPNLLKAGIVAADKVITKNIKHRSARKELDV